MTRPPRIVHATSEPLVFFGRREVLSLLDEALGGAAPSVVGLVGPGGQGKTAIAQHWLHHLSRPLDGVFLWSFYRGKDADLCLREWLAYAEGSARPDVSASYCAQRLLDVLRRERWAVVLDGAEVAQHEGGDWRGRFHHPDLAWLLEELASVELPGIVVLTSRFSLPTLTRRPFFRLVELDRLDDASSRALLASLGVRGNDGQLDALAAVAGRHAKAVELLGAYLVRFHAGRAVAPFTHACEDEEASVARVLGLFTRDLAPELQDLLALATAFRDPPAEPLLLDYLSSPAVRSLLHETWRRDYTPFSDRGPGWLAAAVQELVSLRLLERVGPGPAPVIDAHPLVRRGFEHVAGAGRRESALARSGFLRGRPDRRRPATLEEAREAVELFHAHCDAGLWNEADSAFVALENPKYRFLAPAFERDLLLRFFPERDWRRPALWPGFGRWRSLAICLEMLGDFEAALLVYPPADAALRGDALLAMGRLGPILATPTVAAPWQALWQAYRCHALCLAGEVAEAVRLARSLVPVDVYEWAHVFECLLRADALAGLDLRGLDAQPLGDHPWAGLARRRIRADFERRTAGPSAALDREYLALTDAYDRAGLPLERALVRLSHAALLAGLGRPGEALAALAASLRLARQRSLRVVEVDALEWQARLSGETEQGGKAAAVAAGEVRRALGLAGPSRP